MLAILAQAGVDARNLSESELDVVWAEVPWYVICAAVRVLLLLLATSRHSK